MDFALRTRERASGQTGLQIYCSTRYKLSRQQPLDCSCFQPKSRPRTCYWCRVSSVCFMPSNATSKNICTVQQRTCALCSSCFPLSLLLREWVSLCESLCTPQQRNSARNLADFTRATASTTQEHTIQRWQSRGCCLRAIDCIQHARI